MKELCFSGIQPTNIVHIGNYIGALKQWVDIQHRYPCLFCIVDLHAITVPQDPKTLRENNRLLAATYLAAELDPKRSHIFIQSEVAEHTELAWILSTVTKKSELERMTQYKEKSRKFDKKSSETMEKILRKLYTKKFSKLSSPSTETKIDNLINESLKEIMEMESENTGAGLFTYPALMAADILLYDTSVVPVGEDQLQHIELTRTIAKRFNTQFGETFIIPKSLVQKTGARIMGLDDPSGKMSKSATSAANYIALTDTDEDITKKIKKAVTDSGSDISYDPAKRPAIANLLSIYHHATGEHISDIVKRYEGKGYGDFKRDLAEAVIGMVKPIREKIEHYMKDRGELDRILDAGRDAAKEMASAKMKVVRERVGLGR